jgi:hypothetical protein
MPRTLVAVGMLAAVAAAVGAQSRPLTVDSCAVELRDGWTPSGSGATAGDGSSVQIREYQDTETVTDMMQGFARLDANATRILFRRALPQGATQFRSVTRTRPACATNVIARSAASAAAAREIAGSISRRADAD